MLSTGILMLLSAGCRTKVGDTGDSGYVPLDPPGWGQLRLNFEIENFTSSQTPNMAGLHFGLGKLEVEHRRLVAGVLQPPETITLADGPVPLSFYNPHDQRSLFAGQYWLPPGEIQHISADLDFMRLDKPGQGPLVRFAQPGGGWGTAGSVTIEPPQPLTISPDEITGALGTLERGPNANLRKVNGQWRIYGPLDLEAYPAAVPAWYDDETLWVKFRDGVSQSQIDTFYQSTGATEVVKRATGLRLVRFDPPPTVVKWAHIVQKMAQYQGDATSISGILGFASLNPNITLPIDNNRWDDDCWTQSNYQWLDSVEIEDAWDTIVGGDPVLGSRDIIVGFVDSGLDINHPDLVNNLWVNEGELPSDCSFDFVTKFDLDGDGVFTLNDLNNPDSGTELEDALDALDDCMGHSGPGHYLNPDWDSGQISGGPWPQEIGLYQGKDLLNAFEDDVDDDENGVEDDLFGALFMDCNNATAGGCTVTNDVDPDDANSAADDVDGLWSEHLMDLDDCGWDGTSCDTEEELRFLEIYTSMIHGTEMAGIVAAADDNGAYGVGVSPRVRIMEARYAQGLEDVNLNTLWTAVDYLVEMGAEIIILEAATTVEVPPEDHDSYIKANGAEFAAHPDVLFVTAAGNESVNCDGDGYACLYPESGYGEPNVISVAAAEVSSGAPVGLAGFSNYGDTITVAAPGANELIGLGHRLDFHHPGVSTFPEYESYDSGMCEGTSGTSAAIAVVGGIAALATDYCALNGVPFSNGDESQDALLDLVIDSSLGSTFGVDLDVQGSNYVQAAPLSTAFCP